nr:helitron helicase-like domain-containing protein [Tanacetum cinerariifolium]
TDVRNLDIMPMSALTNAETAENAETAASKLVPKNIVVGGVGQTGIVDSKGSCSGDCMEVTGGFASNDRQQVNLTTVVGGVGQMGILDTSGSCSDAYMASCSILRVLLVHMVPAPMIRRENKVHYHTGAENVPEVPHSHETALMQAGILHRKERIKDNPKSARPKYHRCCMAGRVVTRTYQIYPEYMKLLLRDRHFLENIRAYNKMFSMTSLGARVDDSINVGRGPYVFKILGELYHLLGSLSPAKGDPPRFLQVYLYDTENELLKSEVPLFKIRLCSVVGAREYELPTMDMLRAIMYEPIPETEMDYDIIIEQFVYTVEFQKRGLPHCYTLIWIDESSRMQNHEDIDNYISTELPSKESDPECHRVVSEFMIHGPCGVDMRITSIKQNVTLDNDFVVPYNKKLCKTFYAHINV